MNVWMAIKLYGRVEKTKWSKNERTFKVMGRKKGNNGRKLEIENNRKLKMTNTDRKQN